MQNKIYTILTSAALISYAGYADAAPNQVNLVQSGVNHLSVLNQSDNTADNTIQAYQGGVAHQVYVTQVGSANKFDSHQYGSNDYIDAKTSGLRNHVNISQGQYGPAVSDVAVTYTTDNSIATGEIQGDDNSLTISQRGSSLTSYNTVNGSSNTIAVNQGGSGAYFDTRINGNSNKATINQSGLSLGGASLVGTGNEVNVTQAQRGGSATIGAAPLKTFITAQGNGNAITTSQYATDSEIGVMIDNGSSNNVNVRQDAQGKDTAYAVISNGNSNVVAITQLNSYHKAAANVIGSSNNVQITQNGGRMIGTIGVKGDGNVASLYQENLSNDAWADIQGNSNRAYMAQVGTTNQLGLAQRGNDYASLNQYGNSNQLYVNQTNSVASIVNVTQSGNNNYSSVNN